MLYQAMIVLCQLRVKSMVLKKAISGISVHTLVPQALPCTIIAKEKKIPLYQFYDNLISRQCCTESHSYYIIVKKPSIVIG